MRAKEKVSYVGDLEYHGRLSPVYFF